MMQIIPIKDLRNTTELSERCHAKNEPVFVTKNGYGDLVVMSMETYESIMDTHQIDAAIASSEAEMASGAKPLDAKDALDTLRKQYFE